MQYPISIPRGTSYNFAVRVVYDDGTDYPYNAVDAVSFGVKLTPESDTYIIAKAAVYDSTAGNYIVALEPEDTASLVMDERYWYDVGISTSAGDFFLLIDTSPFNVQRAITEAGMII